MHSSIGIDVTVHPDRTVVAVTGELDLHPCPRITEATDALTLRGQTLTLDLSSVTFMDSSALNMLLVLRRRALALRLQAAAVPCARIGRRV